MRRQPRNLWKHVPTEAGARYVAAIGGADRLLEVAREAYATGDFRWVVELVGHLGFGAENGNAAAKALQADSLEQLGFGAENGTWRSAYLAGASELRHDSFGTPISTQTAEVLGALTAE